MDIKNGGAFKACPYKNPFNPTRGSLWNASQVAGGGQILPAPIKTSLEAILTQFFDITLIGGQK